jgi:hypothetical protein
MMWHVNVCMCRRSKVYHRAMWHIEYTGISVCLSYISISLYIDMAIIFIWHTFFLECSRMGKYNNLTNTVGWAGLWPSSNLGSTYYKKYSIRKYDSKHGKTVIQK